MVVEVVVGPEYQNTHPHDDRKAYDRAQMEKFYDVSLKYLLKYTSQTDWEFSSPIAHFFSILNVN